MFSSMGNTPSSKMAVQNDDFNVKESCKSLSFADLKTHNYIGYIQGNSHVKRTGCSSENLKRTLKSYEGLCDRVQSFRGDVDALVGSPMNGLLPVALSC